MRKDELMSLTMDQDLKGATGKRARAKTSQPSRQSRGVATPPSKTSMVVSCYLALAAQLSSVEAWSSTASPAHSRRVPALSFRDNAHRYTLSSLVRSPTITTALPTIITAQLEIPQGRAQNRHGDCTTMLLDGRHLSLPAIASLSSTYGSTEGMARPNFSNTRSTTSGSKDILLGAKPEHRRGVLGFDVLALKSSSSSDIEADVRSETSSNDGSNLGVDNIAKLVTSNKNINKVSSTTTRPSEALGITWHDDGDWRTSLQQQQQPDRIFSLAPAPNRNFPTRAQIDQLRVVELKQACLERGLPSTGKKGALQDRLWKWSLEQQTSHPVKINRDFLSRYYEQVEDENSDELAPALKGGQEDSVDAITRVFDNSTYTPNSLAEWARNIDLEPLLRKRKEIHRRKRDGRQSPTRKPHNSDESGSPSAEYLKSLARSLRAPSLPFSSNIQVKELYAASKQADQLGERKVAMDLLKTLLMVTPSDARVYRRLARMHTENGDVRKARGILEVGLQQQKENPWLWHGLGQLERTHGAIDLAKEYFEKAISSDATFAHSYHALATLEHGLGNVASAMRILKKGLEFCPTNHRLWHAYGDVYRAAQMLDDAERAYKRAIQHGPPTSHCFAHSSLAAVSYEQGHIDKARRWLFKAIEANNGRHSQGWVALAQLEESEGNIREARLLCTSAIAQYEKGLLEARQRYIARNGGNNPRPSETTDGGRSVQLTNQLLKQVPSYRSGDKFVHVYRNWARLEEKHGSGIDVDRVYLRAKAAFPHDSKLLVGWAQYHDRHLNTERAREIYQEACTKVGHRHASPYRMLGQLEMSQSNFLEARRILFLGTRAVSQSDFMTSDDKRGLPELLLTWAICEWHLENPERAEDLFGHALRLAPADSDFKSFVLYSIARFKYNRGELLLAQHCVGLALKECPAPSSDGKLWELWAQIARDMGNERLAMDCLKKAENAVRGGKEIVDEDKELNHLLGLRSRVEPSRSLVKPSVEKLVRRDPWQGKLFNSRSSGNNSIPRLRVNDLKFPAPTARRLASPLDLSALR